MAVKNSAGVKFNDKTELIIQADPNGTVESVFNKSNNTEYVGGGGSAWTKIFDDEITLSTTDTTATLVKSYDVSDYIGSSTLIYVKIRDKAGKRTLHFYGTDAYVTEPDGIGLPMGRIAQTWIRQNDSNASILNSAHRDDTYGIFAWNVDVDKQLNIYSRYNSDLSRTIDGDYTIEIFTIDFPS